MVRVSKECDDAGGSSREVDMSTSHLFWQDCIGCSSNAMSTSCLPPLCSTHSITCDCCICQLLSNISHWLQSSDTFTRVVLLTNTAMFRLFAAVSHGFVMSSVVAFGWQLCLLTASIKNTPFELCCSIWRLLAFRCHIFRCRTMAYINNLTIYLLLKPRVIIINNVMIAKITVTIMKIIRSSHHITKETAAITTIKTKEKTKAKQVLPNVHCTQAAKSSCHCALPSATEWCYLLMHIICRAWCTPYNALSMGMMQQFSQLCPWWPWSWPWHSNSSERGSKHVFPVNLAQICSAVPEIFDAQTKKVTVSAKNRTILACSNKWFKQWQMVYRTSEIILTTLGLNGGCTSRFSIFCQLTLR